MTCAQSTCRAWLSATATHLRAGQNAHLIRNFDGGFAGPIDPPRDNVVGHLVDRISLVEVLPTALVRCSTPWTEGSRAADMM